MGLLPDTQNCGCACAGNAGNVFPVTAGKRSRHASRHVRHARAVMHAGIANLRFPLKSAAGENVPGIPGACATCNFTYLVRGPWFLSGMTNTWPCFELCVCIPICCSNEILHGDLRNPFYECLFLPLTKLFKTKLRLKEVPSWLHSLTKNSLTQTGCAHFLWPNHWWWWWWWWWWW